MNILKRMLCYIGWHSPSKLWVDRGGNGASYKARCPWCGYRGLIDSQGNLF